MRFQKWNLKQILKIRFSKQNWKQNFKQDFKIGNPKGFEMEFEFKGIQMDFSEEIQMGFK